MKKTAKTIKELKSILAGYDIEFVLTRFNDEVFEDPPDLDILVKKTDFRKFVKTLEDAGYKSSSHDRALGGRVKGAQINFFKANRIKIDLHHDFTWRVSQYFDLELIWDNLHKGKVNIVSVSVPNKEIDSFIVIVNLLFEKTYITKKEWQYIKKNYKRDIFKEQAEKYGWSRSYQLFNKWWSDKNDEKHDFPVFLPTGLIIYSFLEKFNLISFLYYFFFRIRYIVNKKLPYD